MVDFRRCFLAIAVLVLAIGFVAPASAQVATFQCVANAAVPPSSAATRSSSTAWVGFPIRV